MKDSPNNMDATNTGISNMGTTDTDTSKTNKPARDEELILARFGTLTDIQKQAIPKIREGKNVLIVAPTGSGKTEAALLPSLEKIDKEIRGIQILYITPLKSLNRDMLRRFEYWCNKFNVSYQVRHGDTPQSIRTKQRINPPSILIITLETLQALLMGKIIRRHLLSLKVVIIDEIHEIIASKRGAQLSLGLERLGLLTNFQRIAMSATLNTPEKDGCMAFGKRNFSIVSSDRIRNFKAEVRYIKDVEKRLDNIANTCKTIRVLLFVNTRKRAEELSIELNKRNTKIEIHHGSLSKEIRTQTENNFRNGTSKSIIATSSLELGVDIGNVDLVIQYGSPKQVTRFLQRIGRSGHTLNKIPKGIIYALDDDDYLESESIIARARTGWMEQLVSENNALDVIAHQLNGLVLDKKTISLDEAHKILSKSCLYNITNEKLHHIALQLESRNIIEYDFENRILKMGAECRKYYYTNISTIPKAKRYKILDITSKKLIAYIDERFIANLEIGTNFVMQGRVWNVGDLTENEVMVTPSPRIDVVLPEWTGEGIILDSKIAEDVWQLRKSYYKVSAEIERELPKDNEILVELIQDLIIIHYPGGSKTNRTITHIISHKLGEILNERIKGISDPYRIIFKSSYPLPEKYIRALLTKNISSSSSAMEMELNKSLIKSSLIRIVFQNVARLFGFIDENTTISQGYLKAMKNSLIFEESLRYIKNHYLDEIGARKFFERIHHKSWTLKIKKLEHPTYLGVLGLTNISKGRKSSLTPREELYTKFLENIPKRITLQCLECNSPKVITITLTDWKNPICDNCGSDAFYIYKRQVEKSEDTKNYEASLIRNYGKRAIIALLSYGIGVNTAERILGKLHRDDKTFIQDIIDAQKRFLNNRRFWKKRQ